MFDDGMPVKCALAHRRNWVSKSGYRDPKARGYLRERYSHPDQRVPEAVLIHRGSSHPKLQPAMGLTFFMKIAHELTQSLTGLRGNDPAWGLVSPGCARDAAKIRGV